MIKNQELIKILGEWSYWNSPPKQGVHRQIYLPSKLETDLVLIIQGVRRCGKSTLLSQLPGHYQLNLQRCFYCNFEDPRLLDDLSHRLLSQIVEIARERCPDNKPCYFFLDEIQNVLGWEKWLHTQLERSKENYFVLTGSNSCLLSGEFATALTGRHITIELYPFSLNESQLVYPEYQLEDYLLSGGFPRALTYDNPSQLLQEYFTDIILRDVRKRCQARSSDLIQQVVRMTFDSCGSQLSYRKIAAQTGLTPDTVKSYLDACKEAYLLFECSFFTFSERKRLANPRKYYPIDPGLRHAVTLTNPKDYGKSLELVVYLKLIQKYAKVYYWYESHQGEVDFVAMDNQKIIPYQVSWKGVKPRHEKSLELFYQAYPHAEEAIIISRDNVEEFLL